MRSKKIYIIIVIFSALLLFIIAATCNQCSVPVEITESTETTEEPLKDNSAEVTVETTATSEPEEDKQITELPKEILSEDQQLLLSMFGYPDEYIIIFDEGNDNTRIDIWIFEAMQASFSFEAGKYTSSEIVITPKLLPDIYNITPEEFVYSMTPDEVECLIGEKGVQIIETNTSLKTIVYGKGNIICTYNPDDQLVYVSRSKEIEITGG